MRELWCFYLKFGLSIQEDLCSFKNEQVNFRVYSFETPWALMEWATLKHIAYIATITRFVNNMRDIALRAIWEHYMMIIMFYLKCGHLSGTFFDIYKGNVNVTFIREHHWIDVYLAFWTFNWYLSFVFKK